MTEPDIEGFLAKPVMTANGSVYAGRLSFDDVQFTGRGKDAIATFTITVRQLLDAADSGFLWTDQDVQRGVRPEISAKVPRELAVREGYPDPKIYIFSESSADEMADKLLRGFQLFINPLVWNLRPGKFEAFSDQASRKIYLYGGKVYLPDSHHRHQAILKAARIFKEAPQDYKHFDLEKQFKVDLYFLEREDEGNYFFQKNQLSTPTAKSKAYDLTTQDDLSVLAKKVIDLTPTLHANVNRVTDRLSARTPDLVTLSTLREMLRSTVDYDHLDETELEGIAKLASSFLSILAKVRPELGSLSVADRKAIRARSLVDAPIMFQGYGSLISDFISDVAHQGFAAAVDGWEEKLRKLASSIHYSEARWTGDFFDKANPAWTRLGIVRPGLTGRPTVSNTRASKLQVSRALRSVVANDPTKTTQLELIVQ